MHARHSASLCSLLAALCLAAAPIAPHASGDPPSTRHAQPAQGIDVASCLDALRHTPTPDVGGCPGYLVGELVSGLLTCGEVGGTLVPESTPTVWALDVTGDGKPEIAFALDAVVGCEGAASVFSCGSLGCPLTLYEERETQWQAIGALFASAPESIEVLESGAGHRDLRIGCFEDHCTEYSYYRWTGESYERTRLQVRGYWVDFAGSVHGLRYLAGETALLATPAPDGEVLARYDAETEVAVIGQAEVAPYFYVSPCNACESGFVAKSVLRDP